MNMMPENSVGASHYSVCMTGHGPDYLDAQLASRGVEFETISLSQLDGGGNEHVAICYRRPVGGWMTVLVLKGGGPETYIETYYYFPGLSSDEARAIGYDGWDGSIGWPASPGWRERLHTCRELTSIR